ncbi:Tab2/Atab2 family RNA-binding protein [Merismopedia glauca]|uniref:DUF1092 family protein n=1 Tax=Merismopedia glauca CCAP 1448/3 TaxID=1296344 RepID=A0A2T1BZZ7_9CYAN|nr:Tab2/Atab2 family RNA-binding protein [Merismopedia glauca]PSB01581.1 hypothetical protein C7B64_17585 [Merismopedia glauca CCAP 1448/3]
MSGEVWQVDFYRYPVMKKAGQVWWLLVICESTGQFAYEAYCPQTEVNSAWLVSHLQQATNDRGDLPSLIQVFRPQSLNLLELAASELGIAIQATRRTPALKEHLQAKAKTHALQTPDYNPLALDAPPPAPLPDHLLGQSWRFASLPASELEATFAERPIPVLEMPKRLLPINLGLASTVAIPGVIVYGGRRSLVLARWLQEAQPYSLNYIPGSPDGLILEAGLVDRWILATFTDADVAIAAQTFTKRKQTSQGLHFLSIQPDDSGMTDSGFWLLQE